MARTLSGTLISPIIFEGSTSNVISPAPEQDTVELAKESSQYKQTGGGMSANKHTDNGGGNVGKQDRVGTPSVAALRSSLQTKSLVYGEVTDVTQRTINKNTDEEILGQLEPYNVRFADSPNLPGECPSPRSLARPAKSLEAFEQCRSKAETPLSALRTVRSLQAHDERSGVRLSEVVTFTTGRGGVVTSDSDRDLFSDAARRSGMSSDSMEVLVVHFKFILSCFHTFVLFCSPNLRCFVYCGP